MKKIKPVVILGNSVPSGLHIPAQTAVVPADCGLFNSGEPFAELFPKDQAAFETNAALLKGCHAVIVQSGGAPVGDNVLHALMLAHNARTRGAENITMVMPFLPFLRQDRDFDRRFCSLGAAFFAGQLKATGVTRVLTLTPHSQGSIKTFEDAFGADNFTAAGATDLFRDEVLKICAGDLEQASIGAPDGADKPADEGQRRARDLCAALFGTPAESRMFRIGKAHTAQSETKVTTFDGDVAGKTCFIIDDMIDGGSTMINAARALKDRGAARVVCMATHGILSGSALERLLSPCAQDGTPLVDRLVVTDLIPGIMPRHAAVFARQPAFAQRVAVLPATAALLESALDAVARRAVQPIRAAPNRAARRPGI